jgi:hypothetical protein
VIIRSRSSLSRNNLSARLRSRMSRLMFAIATALPVAASRIRNPFISIAIGSPVVKFR